MKTLLFGVITWAVMGSAPVDKASRYPLYGCLVIIVAHVVLTKETKHDRLSTTS